MVISFALFLVRLSCIYDRKKQQNPTPHIDRLKRVLDQTTEISVLNFLFVLLHVDSLGTERSEIVSEKNCSSHIQYICTVCAHLELDNDDVDDEKVYCAAQKLSRDSHKLEPDRCTQFFICFVCVSACN